MSNPDEIRAEIAQTRSDLSNNVNALGEAVRPATWPGIRSRRSVRRPVTLRTGSWAAPKRPSTPEPTPAQV